MSSQNTNAAVQKLTHKTPQIKPAMPGSLSMAHRGAPDTYSNDDKQNEGFALPLVGKRRKACEAGFNQKPAEPLKRSNVSQQGQPHKKEARGSADGQPPI